MIDSLVGGSVDLEGFSRGLFSKEVIALVVWNYWKEKNAK